MGLGEKFKNFITPIDTEEDTEIELTNDEVEKLSQYEHVKNNNLTSNKTTNAKMVLFEPRDFEEAEEIAFHLKARRACVVNLHRVPKEYAQRIIDFLSGTLFALDGVISKVGENVILCTPKEMSVAGDISLNNNSEE